MHHVESRNGKKDIAWNFNFYRGLSHFTAFYKNW